MRLSKFRGRRIELIRAYDGSGMAWCAAHTQLADEAVASAFAEVGAGSELAVAAVGGYGRRELGPHGDLDIVFLSSSEAIAEEASIRALFRALIETANDAGWEIDYALRYPSDAPGLDDKSRTALLDARLIAGSQGAFDTFMRAFKKTFPVAQFLSDKRRERLRYRDKLGYTPQRVEFNIRDGAGGLRDYQAASWFRTVLECDPISGLDPEYDRMIAVRNALQIATGRKEDRLIRTRHSEVSAILAVPLQDLFSELMQSATLFRDEWRKARKLALESTFPLAEGVDAVHGRCMISTSATLSEAAAGVVRGVDLDMDVPLGEIPNTVIGDGPATASYLSLGGAYLRALDRAGVLSASIPEFRDAKYLLPEDSVHEYTVGEHTLTVVDQLDALRSESIYDLTWSEFETRTLYLAAILHDLGKADHSAPHSETGAKIARGVGARLKLAPSEVETICWLVLEHLTLANIVRTHDLQTPVAPIELARICGAQNRLAMLYLLTIADISAVSADALTPQFLVALKDLYEKARSLIGEDDLPTDPAVYRSAALEQSRRSEDSDTLTRYLETMPTHYLLGTPRQRFADHADYVARAYKGEMTIVFENNAEAGTTDITVCCADLKVPGLLSRMLGVLFAHDLTMHGVRAASTNEPDSVALDQLTVSYRGGVVPKQLGAAISASLKRYLSNKEELETYIRNHHKDADQPQMFLKYKLFPGEPAILEIETPIGTGMPYRVTKMLAHFGWNVYVARMGQWAGRAVARFYLSDPNGPLTEDKVATAISNYQATA